MRSKSAGCNGDVALQSAFLGGASVPLFLEAEGKASATGATVHKFLKSGP